MAKYRITSPDGETFEVNAPDGATEADAIEYVKNNMAAPKEASNGITRQLGLTARHGLQGLAGTAGLVVDPINALINKATGSDIKTLRGATENLLDRVGLPTPQTKIERNVGEASELLAGTGGLIKGVGKGMLAAAGARPGLQAVSASSAGYAGSEAREQGANGGEQVAASVAAGIGVPVGVAGLQNAARPLVNSAVNAIRPNQINQQIEAAIRQAGIDLNTLPVKAQQQLRTDVQKALQTGNLASPDAIRRLTDYRALNATPMRGNITLNPVDITRDKNIAKLGANSTDPVANQLANTQNANNAQLIAGLNDLGANVTDDVYGAGQKVIGSLESRDQSARKVINQFYNEARAADGRSANIDPRTFTQSANDLLDDALLGGKLPGDVRNKLNSIAQGKTPLTVDVAEQFKTNIGALQRASNDPSERLALSKVREALDNAPLIDGQGQGAVDAFNRARKVNSAYMRNVEKTPALQAVRDGIEPDKFVQQFIIGNGGKSNVMDVAMLKKNLKGDTQAMQAIRGQILAHLKGKGLNGAADEVGIFSPSGYNNALQAVGERKLNLFFDKAEIEQLKRIGRVASYENVQPKGSAVNNSNTAGALFSNTLDLLAKVPGGKMLLVDPVQNIGTSYAARQSINAPKALTLQQRKQVLKPSILPLGLLADD
jgi:hypothetical protein